MSAVLWESKSRTEPHRLAHKRGINLSSAGSCVDLSKKQFSTTGGLKERGERGRKDASFTCSTIGVQPRLERCIPGRGRIYLKREEIRYGAASLLASRGCKRVSWGECLVSRVWEVDL